MEWIDEGLILSALPHGETASIVTLMTAEHGRFAGLVAGGQAPKHSAYLQPGSLVQARWRARLPEHLGSYAIEVQASLAARWMDAPEVLGLIASAVAVTEASLPERQPLPGLFAGLKALFELEDRSLWPPAYIQWEMGVLKALGYGMDLSCCALSGETEGLAFISPRTGRAVTAAAAAPYREKLLPLPRFLCGIGGWDEDDIRLGLDLTAHFLSRHVFAHPQNRRLVPVDGALPLARQRLADYFACKTEILDAVA